MAFMQFLLHFSLILCCALLTIEGHTTYLRVGYYGKRCPNVERIIKKVVAKAIREDPTLAAPLLRMHFHDCFVRGCEGSVLLESPKRQAEKDAFANLSLRGFQAVERAKAAVEKACPGVVSCADVLAIVARDATFAIKGPFWAVETGRRDGRISSLKEAEASLIPPSANISTLIRGFAQKGLNAKDLVVLSGSHTIGISRCASFGNRLYNFTGRNDADPRLDPAYVVELKKKCRPGDFNSIVDMDPGSAVKFDVSYFTLVNRKRGLFESDAALLDNKGTKAYLIFQSIKNGPTFFKDFGDSMVKMGRIQVLTGYAGEIRKVCSKVN